MSSAISAARIHITGIVQGVGFRPFVYNLAVRLRVVGWVRNTSAGVDIHAEGADKQVAEFTRRLTLDAPPLAKIDSLEIAPVKPTGFTDFQIVHSEPVPGAFQPISPDIGICPDCLRELFDPADRRYRYPFINCTNCGPRLTIIADIPYDRPNTTMSGFPMCPQCAAEYTDPADRRFHAQPTACPTCGPRLWLEIPSTHNTSIVEENQAAPGAVFAEAALTAAQKSLASGQVLAVKGLGGFHLACNACNPEAVSLLRQRKLRVDKPFAVMMADIATIEQHCLISPAEAALLDSPQRPIVILTRRPGSTIANAVSPNQNTLGVMLAYTPLHHLLFVPAQAGDKTPPQALVMTSGNLSEEPIAFTNAQARQCLGSLADVFLFHNRPIRTRCDDSVVRLHPAAPGQVTPIRRSRGYAPFPVHLPWKSSAVLACGAELKNTFCITQERYAFLSQHIGDLQNYETLDAYLNSIQHYARLFKHRPALLAHDLHPDYLSTRYATERAEREPITVIGVQHHHAHIASVMAENGVPATELVIGIALDGTGYGLDGAIWGGEFLVTSYTSFERIYHLEYLPLPGGDHATRHPARIALAYLWACGLDWQPNLPSAQELCAQERQLLRGQLTHQINTPLTSSMGRLFDAVSALVGVRQKVNYEAQAAIELEMLVDPNEPGGYPLHILSGSSVIKIAPLLEAVLADISRGCPAHTISAKFHNTIAHLVCQASISIRSSRGINSVALSGGVWQNHTLLANSLRLLSQAGFCVYTHQRVPCNDGGLSLGQAAIAHHLYYSS